MGVPETEPGSFCKCSLLPIHVSIPQILFFLSMCVHGGDGGAHACEFSALRGQKRAVSTLVLKLPAVVSHCMWVPDTESRSSAGAARGS